MGRSIAWLESERVCGVREACASKVEGELCGSNGSANVEDDEDGRHLRSSPLKTKQHTTLRRVLGQPSAGERRWSATLVARW